MRRFEFQEGTSHKFWEVSVEGDEMVVRFGKVGTQGQTQAKSFESEDAALRAAEKLVSEKLRKGYVEVAAPEARPGLTPAAVAPRAQEPAARPRDASSPGTRVLLRDSSGEELVVLLAGRRVLLGEGEERKIQAFPSAEAAKEHFERILFLRGKQGLVPVETTQVPAEQLAAELERAIENFEGTVEVREGRCTITFRGDDKVPLPVCTGLVKRLVREAPRSVHLVCDFASPKQAWARALQGVTLPSVKSFIFDTPSQTQTRQGRNSVGDLATVLAACPQLERLFATGELALSPARHESLRELYLLGEPLSPALFEGLGRCEFPRLECLALSLASDSGPISSPQLLQALHTLRAPVREVYLDGLDSIGEALETLAAQGLPPSWNVLILEGSWGDDDDPEAVRALLQRHAGALGALKLLGLPDDVEVEGAPVPTEPAQESRELFLPSVYSAW